MNDINVLEGTSVNKNTFIKSGYILLSETTLKNTKKSKEDNKIIAVGGVYQKSNISRSYINLNNIGTLIGTLELDNIKTPYNYIQTLIPGQYPIISGPWTENQENYNLQTIYDFLENNSNNFFCKILGLGLGELKSYKVSEVSRNGITTCSNLNIAKNNQGLQNIRSDVLMNNYSNITQDLNYPESLVGSSQYIQGYDWVKNYGIESINGTNTFPFFGWAGSRVGSIQPQNFQFLESSTYNYPSSLLELSKNYNPLGIVYAGQGIQLNSFPLRINNKNINDNNNKTYKEYLNKTINSIRFLGILPYQQGRGVYDIFNRQIQYSDLNGLTDYVEIQNSIASEGVIPGRNNAFIGVAITDYWSDNLNLNNVENNSRISDNIRFKNQEKQSKTAHNAPLVFISSKENNTENALPWNSTWSYIGTNTSSPSNQRSSNTPILTEGITTMCISGAYPLYRGTHSSQWAGCFDFIGGGAKITPQYYISKDFWKSEFKHPSIPEIIDKPPMVPNPPYKIKGGKIILKKGQRVKAGSYVYSCMNGVGNVSIPQFYPPSAKEIILNEGERDQLMGDLYSKYQSNQGGLIVMVSIDGQEPPNPPSCAQPIGIILEDIEGYGEFLYKDNSPDQNLEVFIDSETYFETAASSIPTLVQPKFIKTRYAYDPLKTNSIQAREVLIKFFPMYPNMEMSGMSCGIFEYIFGLSTPFPLMCCSNDISQTFSKNILNDGFIVNPKPVMVRIKNNYMINAGENSIGKSLFSRNYPFANYGLDSVQMRNDFPTFG